MQTKSLLTQIYEGGWVMIPIAICSMLTVYFIGDGVSRTSRKRIAPPQHIEALKNLFRGGDYVGAYDYCKPHPSPLTNVLRIGISMLGEGKDVCETAMQEELGKENSEIQTRISYLSVIGVCTPMIGLLGTVTGMIKAFATLGQSGIGDPSKLSGAIGEVLDCDGERPVRGDPGVRRVLLPAQPFGLGDAPDSGLDQPALPQDALGFARQRPHRRRRTFRGAAELARRRHPSITCWRIRARRATRALRSS